jgi:hypothetical protein
LRGEMLIAQNERFLRGIFRLTTESMNIFLE